MASSAGYGINLNLPSLPETKDAALFQELARIYSAINTLASYIEKQHVFSIKSSVAISAGLMVNVFKDTDNEFKLRLADASLGYYATGFVLTDVAAGAFVEVSRFGVMGAYTGLLGNTVYYLGLAGIASSVKPTASGTIAQAIGTALADNLLYFNPSLQVEVNP